MVKLIRVKKYQGIYYRDSIKRKFQGKADRCFYITYKRHQKKVWEKAGWRSEGYSAEFANAMRGKRLQQIRNHEDFLPKAKQEITFGKVWSKYDRWLETGKSRPRDDRYNYQKHLKKRFENKHLSEITPLSLEKLKTKLFKSGLKPATVKHILVLIRQIINKAIAWELWEGTNPIKKIDLPIVNNRKNNFYTREQSDLLLSELKKSSQQLHDISFISQNTGMRASEIFALQWENVDLENKTIKIMDPKNKESRSTYINDEVLQVFSRIGVGETGELVFKSRKGDKIKEVSKTFKRANDRIGFNDGLPPKSLERLTFHSLRHTFASWLAQKGYSLQVIMELLGHKDLKMVLRYAHLIPDTKKSAVMQLNDPLS